MAINAKDFTFCDKKLSDFGFIIASFDTSSDDTVNCGNVELITSQPPLTSRNIVHGINYGEPITLIFQIVKFDFATCTCSETPVTDEEYESLMRWLVKPNYNYLNFDKMNICFNVFIKVTAKKIGGNVQGFEITATNDSIYSYSELKKIEYEAGTWTFEDSSFVIGHTYPELLTLTTINDGTIDLISGDGKKTTITNCKAGEIITMRGEYGIITSSDPEHDLSSDFNFVFFKFSNTEETRENLITIENATLSMQYRFKRMVTM